jgi:hypothetical protein
MEEAERNKYSLRLGGEDRVFEPAGDDRYGRRRTILSVDEIQPNRVSSDCGQGGAILGSPRRYRLVRRPETRCCIPGRHRRVIRRIAGEYGDHDGARIRRE